MIINVLLYHLLQATILWSWGSCGLALTVIIAIYFSLWSHCIWHCWRPVVLCAECNGQCLSHLCVWTFLCCEQYLIGVDTIKAYSNIPTIFACLFILIDHRKWDGFSSFIVSTYKLTTAFWLSLALPLHPVKMGTYWWNALNILIFFWSLLGVMLVM
jgi:hypothetical protein